MSLTSATSTDATWMQRCLHLAQQAAGQTSPNPMVGSVIVEQEHIIGEGFHPGAGNPHSEVFALKAAGDRARGATLYVNLEPCNHTGRTPPCTEAIINAGIRRVVVGQIDPDPRVSGRGVQRLRDAGIAVTVGVEEAACRQLNEAFIHSVQHGQPFGILKYAMTLDGKIAASSGHSAWVTSPASRTWVHRLRSRCDAIIVGGQTVRQDNPSLTSHGQGASNPLRVIISRRLDLPTTRTVWQIHDAPTLVFCHQDADAANRAAIAQQGVEIMALPQVTLPVVMQALQTRGCRSVLWECGGRLSAQAIAQDCVQKIAAFIAPKIIGGSEAPTPVGDLGLMKMTDAYQLENLTVEPIDSDLLIQGYLPTRDR